MSIKEFPEYQGPWQLTFDAHFLKIYSFRTTLGQIDFKVEPYDQKENCTYFLTGSKKGDYREQALILASSLYYLGLKAEL